MKLLVDTNVVLEVLFGQKRLAEAQTFLTNLGHTLSLSDYSLHSIGNALFREKKRAVYLDFITDFIIGPGIEILTLPETDHGLIKKAAEEYGLDFDDAYQYAVAEKYDLTLVSFDKDFDRTERGRKTPSEVLKQS